MPYSYLDDVKVVRLRIDPSDTTDDDRIQAFIEQADSMIDEVLSKLGFQTPLTNPSSRIKHLSADIAALLYRAWNTADPVMIRRYKREIRLMLREFEKQVWGGEVLVTQVDDIYAT